MNQQETTAVETPKFGGLDNKEIIMVYYRMKKMTDNMDQNLNERKIQKVVDTPMGKGVAYVEVSQDKIDKFRSSEYYTTMHKVLEKLEPIVSLLEDCDPEFKKFADELR